MAQANPVASSPIPSTSPDPPSSSSIHPFQIAVPDSALANLREKLAAATFPHDVDFADEWAYGAPLADIKRLTTYWRDGFDWRAAEARLNRELPQFTTRVAVDGFGELEVHFVHARASREGSVPLLFCHGWPGSFYEASKLVPLLTQGDGSATGPTFHVVVPSLPNFGFSEAVSKPGFAIPQYAELCHKLMTEKLGYKSYVTQGGDWGFSITRQMGVAYGPATEGADGCLASHMNFIPRVSPPSLLRQPLLYLRMLVTPYTPAERQAMQRSQWFRGEGMAYFHEQSTRPHTLGFALADSPVALLAWIYEKLHDWSDDRRSEPGAEGADPGGDGNATTTRNPGGGADRLAWTDDEVLTWISIYLFSRAGANASVRIYYESMHMQGANKAAAARVTQYNPRTKLGISYFPRDLAVMLRLQGHTLGPVVAQTIHADGGHFAAWERPDVLAADVRQMFGKGGGAEREARQAGAKV